MNNLIEKLNSIKGTINPRYDATVDDIDELYRAYSHDLFRLIGNSFRYGYMQGQKAEKALQRKTHTA